MMSTIALASNDGSLNNADYFMNTFLDPGSHRTAVWNRFLEFYQTAYRELIPEANPPEGLEEVLRKAEESQIKRVLATNPIYPIAAYAHRLSWIGMTLEDFDLITHIENSGYVKPNAGYFSQIISGVGAPAESCLMIGNDPAYDMAASQIGMQTFLTTDAPERDYTLPGIPTSDLPQQSPDHSGRFHEVRALLG
jgi:FMN phosphatase YigB (HAD superfamily)